MYYPLTDIQAEFKINRPVIDIKLPQKKLFPQTDRRTDRWRDGQTDVQTSRTTTIGIFNKKILKMDTFNSKLGRHHYVTEVKTL